MGYGVQRCCHSTRRGSFGTIRNPALTSPGRAFYVSQHGLGGDQCTNLEEGNVRLVARFLKLEWRALFVLAKWDEEFGVKLRKSL